MATYKNDYDKLLESIQSSGQNWSQYDLELAKNNPDAGWSIYESKNDWLDAQKRGDQNAMQAANTAANNVRGLYGNYSGGADGASYQLKQTYDPVPEFTQYESKYADEIDALMRSIQNRDPFSYSPDADVSYQAYAEKYRNAGQKARDDAIGTAASMTGGIPSSYAMTAAQQAQNNYNAALSDVLPQLEQLAYSKYVDEGNQMRDNLSTLIQLDNDAYARHMDAYNSALNNWQLGYGVDRDRLSDLRYDDETAYSRQIDERNYQASERELALNQAMAMLEMGVMPSTDLITAAQLNGSDVNAIYQAVREQMAAKNTSGGSGSSGRSSGKSGSTKTSKPADVYAWLKQNGAKDAGTAYAMLIDAGYAQGTAKTISDYFGGTYLSEKSKATKVANAVAAEHDESETGSRYPMIAGYIEEMRREGRSYSEIVGAITDAYNAGFINKTQRDDLMKKK